MFRALALRHLELPVREFLQQGLEKDSAFHSRRAGSSRSQSERMKSVMTRRLNYIAAAHGVNEKAEKEAQNILKAWLEHPAHPILKASVLERSIFFVLLPFMRFNGDVGIRTVSADISRDEISHVGIHSLVSRELGENAGQSLNKLRRATALWVFDELGQSENKWLNKDFWLRQSDNLFSRGKAEELSDTQRSRMPAFFEAPNTSLPSYGKA